MAEELKVARMSKGLSMADAAKAVGVSIQTVHAWEQGKGPTARHIPKVAEIYGLAAEDIARAVVAQGSSRRKRRKQLAKR